MKRHDRKVQFTFIMVLLALMITACGKKDNKAVNIIPQNDQDSVRNKVSDWILELKQ